MLFIKPDATCEHCGSDDLVVETAESIDFPFSNSVSRIRCCKCGEILLTDYKDPVLDYLSEKEEIVKTYFDTHVIPRYFYQCLFGELVKLFGVSLTNPDQIYFDDHEDYTYEQLVACYLTNICGTTGWNLAFREACAQCDIMWSAQDYDKFDWICSDIFDGYIVENLIEKIFKEDITDDYYFYKLKENEND